MYIDQYVQDKMIIKRIQNGLLLIMVMQVVVFADIHKNYKDYLVKSRKQPQHIRKNFTFDLMKEKFVEIIDTIRLVKYLRRPKQSI